MGEPPVSKDPWIKWFPGDFLHGVSELEANEGWVYTIVLNLIYDAGGPWPLSVDRLSRRCRLRPSTVQKALDALYDLGKLTLVDGRLTNGKAEKSIKSRQKVSENSAEAANARWDKERAKSNENNGTGYAAAMPGVCEPDANQKLEARTRKVSEANASSVGSASPEPTGHLFEVAEPEQPAKPKRAPWDGDADFAALWAGSTDEMRARAKSKLNCWPAWKAAKSMAGGGGVIVAALARYRAKDPDVGRTGGPGLHRWLKDSTWALWMADGAGDVAPTRVWPGPADLRAEIVRATTEDFAVGYLDPCEWRGDPAAVIAPNTFTASKLRAEAGHVFDKHGVGIVATRTKAGEAVAA